MKQKILMAIMAFAVALSFASCRNDIDSLLDDYDDAVSAYIEERENSTLIGRHTFGKDKLEVRRELVEKIEGKLESRADEMDGSQTMRMTDIKVRYVEADSGW